MFEGFSLELRAEFSTGSPKSNPLCKSDFFKKCFCWWGGLVGCFCLFIVCFSACLFV